MKVISLRDFQNEEFWNTITHFVGFILCLVGIPLLFYFNQNLTSLSFVACALFSLGLLMVYGSSSAYHFVIDKRLKKKLRILDHISIYYLILGSYAPMCSDHSLRFIRANNIFNGFVTSCGGND
jgi:hemolysin III